MTKVALPIYEPDASTGPFLDDLRAIYAAIRPRTVGCLSAIDLSALPLREFLRGGSRVWLVDEQPGRPTQAVVESIIRKVGDSYSCLACEVLDAGSKVCATFTPPTGGDNHVCSSFMRLEDYPARCERFEVGSVPHLLVADGNLGRTACFAMRMEEIVANASSATAALEHALEECRRCAKMSARVGIDDNSVDLLISVLAPSQLMAEPFGRFLEYMLLRFGVWQSASRGSKVTRLTQQLQEDLFRMQIDGHVKELRRLVNDDGGRVYFASRAFESLDGGGWSLAHGVALAFTFVEQHFEFDFDNFSPDRFLRSIPYGTPRLVQAMLLRPRMTTDGSSRPPAPNGDQQ
jgi:hypothetical protein